VELQYLLLLAVAGAVLAVGFTRARQRATRAFEPELLADVNAALAQLGFTIESYQHGLGTAAPLRTTGLGLRLNDRVVATLSRTRKGMCASIVVHGMKPPRATLRVARDRGRLRRDSEVHTGDDAFDARHKVNGAPGHAVRALLASTGVRAGIDDLFLTHDGVVELRLLSLGDHGGAVRVELALATTQLDTVRAVADRAQVLADGLDEVG
jgi:hypothetical protein